VHVDSSKVSSLNIYFKKKSFQFRQLPSLDADLDGEWIIMSKTDTSICQFHMSQSF